jgi:hypothetical protein
MRAGRRTSRSPGSTSSSGDRTRPSHTSISRAASFPTAWIIAVRIRLESLDLDEARKTLDALKARDNGVKLGYTRSIALYGQLLDMLQKAPEKPAEIEIQ